MQCVVCIAMNGRHIVALVTHKTAVAASPVRVTMERTEATTTATAAAATAEP